MTKTVRRRIVIGLILVPGLWLALPPLLRHVGFFRVRQIELVGVRNLAPGAVIEIMHLRANASVFDDLDVLGHRLRELPGVADARVVRRLPGALRVIVRETEAVALVPGEEGGPLRVVDGAGRGLPYDPARVAPDLPVAASADTGLVSALALVQSVDPTLFESITAARAGRDVVVLELGARRVLMGRDAGPEVIRAIVQVTHELETSARPYVELDARYARQVVVRRAPKRRTGA